MKQLRRVSLAALGVACLHLIFGAIVRISGSGMGCGDNWPKCYGYWIPPMSRPDLIVEVSHRYLASLLVLAVSAMALTAWAKRRELGVAGRGGPLRTAFGSVAAVFGAAILGGVTVKLGNAPYATVAHWLMAMTLLALVGATAIRAGALGGAGVRAQRGTSRAVQLGMGSAVLAILAVALGGMTAKYPGAAVGCTSFPGCGRNAGVVPSSILIQIVHRTIAFTLLGWVALSAVIMRRRRHLEAPVVVTAAYTAFALVVAQIVVAASMVLLHMPGVLRSLHEATGVGIWLGSFTFAYLARLGARPADPAIAEPSEPGVDAGEIRLTPPQPIAATALVELEAPDPLVDHGLSLESAFEPIVESTIDDVFHESVSPVVEQPKSPAEAITEPPPAQPASGPQHSNIVIIARGADL